MDVLLAHEKHGVAVYDSALALLNRRVADGYWYDGAAAAFARRICRECNEDQAQRFLDRRDDHEYETTEWRTVIA